MKANFGASLSAVLKSEGGNDDDPADHGGRTSRGITQREYSAWLKEEARLDGDVWKAPQEDIVNIYHDEYWEPYCDLMPIGVDYLYFDMAVNAGPGRAAILLQRALGVTADGRIGPVTRNALTAANAEALTTRFSDVKRAFYLSLHQPKFTKGWLNRTAEVKATAFEMIRSVK